MNEATPTIDQQENQTAVTVDEVIELYRQFKVEENKAASYANINAADTAREKLERACDLLAEQNPQFLDIFGAMNAVPRDPKLKQFAKSAMSAVANRILEREEEQVAE